MHWLWSQDNKADTTIFWVRFIVPLLGLFRLEYLMQSVTFLYRMMYHKSAACNIAPLLQPIMKNEISPHYLIHFLFIIMKQLWLCFESALHTIFFKSEMRYIECFIRWMWPLMHFLKLEDVASPSHKKCNSSSPLSLVYHQLRNDIIAPHLRPTASKSWHSPKSFFTEITALFRAFLATNIWFYLIDENVCLVLDENMQTVIECAIILDF